MATTLKLKAAKPPKPPRIIKPKLHRIKAKRGAKAAARRLLRNF